MYGYYFAFSCSSNQAGTWWGAGFDTLTDALEAAVEDAASLPVEKRGKGILIYLTREGEVVASHLLA